MIRNNPKVKTTEINHSGGMITEVDSVKRFSSGCLVDPVESFRDWNLDHSIGLVSNRDFKSLYGG